MERGFWWGSLQRQVGGVETVIAKRATDIHPSLRRRVGSVAETTLLVGTFAAIWVSVCSVLIGAFLR